MKKDSISHTLATAVAGGDRRPAVSSVSKQPSEGHASGCHQLSRTGVSDALIADKEQAAPDRFEPSVCPLLSPILASDLWPSPGAGLWRSTRGGIAGQMGHSVPVFDLCNAPSGRPASSPKHGRDASTFFSFLLLGGISEFGRTPSRLGHCASNVGAGQKTAPSAAGANQRAWRLRSHLAVASRLPGIPAPPSRSETALKLGSKLRDNTQTLS